jgi:hypothetical protein
LRFLAENGEAAFARAEAQPAAELLQEHQMALGGAQEQHRVDLGDVEAFVEQIHRKQDLQLAGAQAADLLGALVAGAGGIQGSGAQAGGHELAGHPAGVLHADAEAQGPHRLRRRRASSAV